MSWRELVFKVGGAIGVRVMIALAVVGAVAIVEFIYLFVDFASRALKGG